VGKEKQISDDDLTLITSQLDFARQKEENLREQKELFVSKMY